MLYSIVICDVISYLNYIPCHIAFLYCSKFMLYTIVRRLGAHVLFLLSVVRRLLMIF